MTEPRLAFAAAALLLLGLTGLSGLAGCASPLREAAAVIRLPNAAPASPTSRAVEVPAGLSTVYVSGQTPEPLDAQAPEFSLAYWGDTAAQTTSVLRKVEAALRAVGLSMGDVVKMNVYLVGDPANGGRMDTAGFGAAYARFFGSAAQPNRPARTTLQIAALGRPGMWVEIDVVAARPAGGSPITCGPTADRC